MFALFISNLSERKMLPDGGFGFVLGRFRASWAWCFPRGVRFGFPGPGLLGRAVPAGVGPGPSQIPPRGSGSALAPVVRPRLGQFVLGVAGNALRLN